LRRRTLLASALLVTLEGCTNFPIIETDECGNAVQEPGEDCDTFVDVPGAICRAPGTVGACHFDCRENADGTRGRCPGPKDGRPEMGCAADGVCRVATHEFEAPELISTDISAWLSSADFDGDGQAEVISAEPPDQLQQARFRLHYFDFDTDLVETRTFPRATTRPIARRLDANRTDDLVFSNFSIGMLPGREDRALLPATFSSYVVDGAPLRAVSVSDEPVGDALGLAAFTTIGRSSGVYVPSRDSGKLALRHQLSRPVAELEGVPLAADLVTTPDSPCAEVIFGYRGDDALRVLDLCEVGTNSLDAELLWRDAPREQVVSLPRGVKLDSQPLAADLDGDGHLDLLVGGAGNTYVAYGDGERLQAEAALLTIPVEGAPEPVALATPLAAGDITGDGAADFVLPTGVVGSRKSRVDGRTVYFPSFQNNAQPWTTAFVADLNGNGLSDVIAATDGAPGLSFLSGNAGPFPVGAHIATRGSVSFLSTGDFDGDLIGDVAYVEGSSSGTDLLAISYGARDQVPLEPLRVAELRGVQQLGRQRDAGLDDVFMASTERDNGKLRGKFTLFGGDASRLPFAPYTLVTFANDGELEDNFCPALMVGSFTNPGQLDVLAIGSKNLRQSWNQWLLSDIGSGKTLPQPLDGMLLDGVRPITQEPIGVRLSVAGAAADLDGDGIDEALWLMPESPSACTLLSYQVDAAQKKVSLQGRLTFEEPCVLPELVAEDLNDDQRPELVLSLGDAEHVASSLQILWNDGSGAFSLEDRSFVRAPDGQGVRSFSLFPTLPRRLAFVTDAALFTAAPGADVRTWPVKPGPGVFEGARSVVASDPNGDGFPDLVVADAGGLWLLEAELR
jgi:hypothetical protein